MKILMKLGMRWKRELSLDNVHQVLHAGQTSEDAGGMQVRPDNFRWLNEMIQEWE